MNRFLTLVVVILTLLTSSILAQDIEKIIDKSAKELLKNKEFNSLSIGIYKDGKQYIRHYGELTKGANNPPTDQTIYEIASVTKTFTGYLVAKAVLEKKLHLDDDIAQYLEGSYSNLTFQGQAITIRHLLTHTAGLPHFMSPEMTEVFKKLKPDAPDNFRSLEVNMTKDLFFELLNTFELKEVPGTKYSYSNAGAELVGYILTSIYSQSIDELLQESFIDRLKMSNTAIRITAAQEKQLAQGYWLQNATLSPNWLNPLWATGAGIKSTMPDLLKYIQFNLNDENAIMEESHKIIYQKKTRWMSYFWNGWMDKHGTSYNHHGGTTGTQNWLMLFPKYDLGISIVTNHSDAKAPIKMRKTISKMLKAVIK